MGLKLHEAERDKIFISSKHYSISPSRSLSLGLGKIGHLIADVMGGNKSKYQGEDNNCSRARRLICIKVVDSNEWIHHASRGALEVTHHIVKDCCAIENSLILREKQDITGKRGEACFKYYILLHRGTETLLPIIKLENCKKKKLWMIFFSTINAFYQSWGVGYTPPAQTRGCTCKPSFQWWTT